MDKTDLRVERFLHPVYTVATPRGQYAGALQQVGTWLSLVERTLGVGEVASSNLVVPTIYLHNQNFRMSLQVFRERASTAAVRR